MQKLTHQEEELMLIIWQSEPGFIKDFMDKMDEPRSPYTTVASVVKNLERKGYVRAKRYGNTYEYFRSYQRRRVQKEVFVKRCEELFREFLQGIGQFFCRRKKDFGRRASRDN